ncbi:MAG: LysR family transcriptional regulator [Burkholderiales bacterium]|nr:LysR family transcriptional regulator [Burkholderiales bacterium]
MRFDLVDLRLFVHVHDAGTITGGAEASHMTLASASERIRGMEDTLGVPLLSREPRGVRPTAAGRTLLQHARLVLQQVERMRGELGDYGAGLRGQVRVLCNTSALSVHLPGLLAGFLSAHPGLSVDLEERPSNDIADALRGDTCDLGLLSDVADLSGLESFVFAADPLVLAVPTGHALAARRSVALAELPGHDFVGLAQGSALHELVLRQARRLGLRLAYRVRLRGLESVCGLVGQGIGVAIVPQAVARRCARTAGVRAVPLSDGWARRTLMLAVRDPPALAPPARQFLQHLRTHAPAASSGRA